MTECSSRIVLLALSDVFETTKSIDACGGFSHEPNEIGIGLYRLLDCVLQLTIIVLIWVLRDYRVQGDAIVDIGEDTLDSIVASWHIIFVASTLEAYQLALAIIVVVTFLRCNQLGVNG